MPDRRRVRHLTGIVAAAVATGLIVASAASAQESSDGWEGSTFTRPSGDAISRVSSFPIAGTFIDEGRTVTAVEVEIGRIDGDVYSEADEDPCVPADPGVVPDSPGNGLEQYDFVVQTPDGEDITWPCNGRFQIRAHATSEGVEGTRTHQIERTVEIAIAPPPVEVVNATVDGETVNVTWEPVDDPSADASGYRVERAGPKKDGTHGPFIAVSGDLGTDSTSATDRPQVSGEYRYRVLSLRRGADDPITAPPDDSASADVSVTVKTTTTTRAGGSGSIPGVGSGGSGPRAPRSGTPRIPRPSPPTTLDTGFEGELDYGERSVAEGPELADGGESAEGGGQSVIRTEDDGAGLVAPAAGALVLLGWAGHVVYLNRLAKQF